MKTETKAPITKKKPNRFIYILTSLVCSIAILLVTAAVVMQRIADLTDFTACATPRSYCRWVML